MTLSLNLSINQITDSEFIRRLREIVDSLDLSPKRINFEITENLFIHNLSLVSSVLEELREMGFGVHLDDFGTGFSSLSYLTELPIDVIKIDRSFIRKLGSQHEPLELLESIVSIGKNLKKAVIAEGIETEEQLAILKGLNCQYGQGFLFSPALLAPDLGSLMLEWPHPSADKLETAHDKDSRINRMQYINFSAASRLLIPHLFPLNTFCTSYTFLKFTRSMLPLEHL